MRAAAHGIGSILVSALLYLFIVGIADVATELTCAHLKGTTEAGAPGPFIQWSVIYLSALLSGATLAHARFLVLPMLTAPLGVMTYLVVPVLGDGGAPWWGAILVVVPAGMMTCLGLLVSSRASIWYRRARGMQTPRKKTSHVCRPKMHGRPEQGP